MSREETHFRVGERVMHCDGWLRGMIIDSWPVEVHLKAEQEVTGKLEDSETRIYEISGDDGKIFVACEEQLLPETEIKQACRNQRSRA